MAPLSLPSTSTFPCTKLERPILKFTNSISSFNFVTKCQSSSKLDIGSPIVIVEAPQAVKTAASIPCLIVNSGLVKPGDVGRIVSRKPKDVWAVRLSIGTYLIDAKYFKPLELPQ
ncbi:protein CHLORORESPIRATORY REDUCTION 42, chloroplastic-like [Mercurialis annua]|uniref:protein CHLORORESPIRATORY REDUCTION 42, chloroplastic-like n=1 Tax=Mercurialis annua TaxID=3986 RepID=UPI00215E9A4F|nr:protein CHLORORESPIRATORY REDUCTION 42, chloroplastic-like [Mercurialis annua]